MVRSRHTAAGRSGRVWDALYGARSIRPWDRDSYCKNAHLRSPVLPIQRNRSRVWPPCHAAPPKLLSHHIPVRTRLLQNRTQHYPTWTSIASRHSLGLQLNHLAFPTRRRLRGMRRRWATALSTVKTHLRRLFHPSQLRLPMTLVAAARFREPHIARSAQQLIHMADRTLLELGCLMTTLVAPIHHAMTRMGLRVLMTAQKSRIGQGTAPHSARGAHRTRSKPPMLHIHLKFGTQRDHSRLPVPVERLLLLPDGL